MELVGVQVRIQLVDKFDVELLFDVVAVVVVSIFHRLLLVVLAEELDIVQQQLDFFIRNKK
jgi:hypothetical protein